jgi:hypothetical protein
MVVLFCFALLIGSAGAENVTNNTTCAVNGTSYDSDVLLIVNNSSGVYSNVSKVAHNNPYYQMDTSGLQSFEGSFAGGSVNYVMNAVSPTLTASPSGGTYYAPQTVVLSLTGWGLIYYTTDGSEPNFNSALYTGPITVSRSMTLKFLAIGGAGTQSQVCNHVYRIYKKVNYSYKVQVPWKKVSAKVKWKKVHGKWRYHWVKVWKYKTVTKTGTKYILT